MTAPPVRTAERHRRRAVVTGGARGIGAAIAARLAADDVEVVILDRLADQAEDSARQCGGHAVTVDLNNPQDTMRAMTDAVDHLGGLDLLVNSAGVFALTPLLDIDVASWDTMMGINARATMVTMQSAARAMIPAGGGAIVNIASMAAKTGGADEAHYAASKAAVVALTRAAALEWGQHHIRVNAICPGFVLTDMGALTRTEQQVAQWTARSPLGRLTTPADVAEMTVYLAGDSAQAITGQALNLTGGMVMH